MLESIASVLGIVGQNNLLPDKEKAFIAVAMSGGVDSTLSAMLLKELGYKIVGITAIFDPFSDEPFKPSHDAKISCEKLGIEHETIDLRKEFEDVIVREFINGYASGETPVPCMICNEKMKFGRFFELAQERLGVTQIASGHYARLFKINNKIVVGRPRDTYKDQSYMLWRLKPDMLEKMVFPLANFLKSETKELASEAGFIKKDKKESQGICFIHGKTADFLRERLVCKPGKVIYIPTGKIIGEHSGTHLFTIGQRKGMGLSFAFPIYVVKIDHAENIVYMGEKEHLFSPGLLARSVNWQNRPEEDKFEALVKIRYSAPPAKARVRLMNNSSSDYPDNFAVEFEKEQTSVTLGQASVLYDLDFTHLLGGGWISRITESE